MTVKVFRGLPKNCRRFWSIQIFIFKLFELKTKFIWIVLLFFSQAWLSSRSGQSHLMMHSWDHSGMETTQKITQKTGQSVPTSLGCARRNFLNVVAVFQRLDCPLSADCPAPQSHLVPACKNKTDDKPDQTSGPFIAKYVKMEQFRLSHFSLWSPYILCLFWWVGSV